MCDVSGVNETGIKLFYCRTKNEMFKQETCVYQMEFQIHLVSHLTSKVEMMNISGNVYTIAYISYFILKKFENWRSN